MYGLTTSYLTIFKNSFSIANYVDMNQQCRRGMEMFGRDLRMATSVQSATKDRISITVLDEEDDRSVVYSFDADNGVFVRTEDAWE